MSRILVGLGIACLVASLVLSVVAGAGFLMRLMVYLFLLGAGASLVSTAIAWWYDTRRTLRYVTGVVLAGYLFIAASVAAFVLIVQPPFG